MRIIVIGGGFGGTYAILDLERLLGKGHDILLFEPRARFVFTPLLHEVAGGVLDKDGVTISYEDLFSRARHVREAVRHIDLDRKVVTANKEYRFDFLIIAVGARTDFFGKEHVALEVKSFEDALAIRQRIEHNARKAAAMLEHDPDADVDDLLSVAVIGAGPTGVEVAGECIDLLKFRMLHEDIKRRTPRITLISAKNSVLMKQDSYFQRTATRVLRRKGVTIMTRTQVTDVSGETIEAAKDGEKMTLRAGTIIWTAGILPNSVPPVQGPARVRDTLQLEGYDFAFAVGDGACVFTAPAPALAQVASKQGELAAHNIARLIRGQEPRSYRFRSSGMLVSLGQRYAVGRILGVPVRGFPAWFIMRTVYLFKFRNIKQEFRTAWEYTKRLFSRAE